MKAYQLKITLQCAETPVWRRVAIPAGIKFGRFRIMMTKAMGWPDGYPCAFRFEEEKLLISHADRRGRMFEGKISPDDEYERADTWEFVIDDLFREGLTFYFDCNFGDVWVHEIEVEKLFADYPHDCPRVLEYAGNRPADAIGDLDVEYDADKVNEALMILSPHGRRNSIARSGSADADEGEDTRARKATPIGPDSFLSIKDRINTMREDELRAAFENPETLFGYLIFDRTPIFDLHSLFESFKRKELQNLASDMQLSGRSGLKKSELIDAIYDCYSKSNLLHLLMSQLDEKEIKVLYNIMHTDVYYVEDEDFPYDFALTLLFHHIVAAFYDADRIAIVAFWEFREKYVEFFEEMREMLDDILDELDEYACAAVNLYGLLPMADFMRIYLDQTDSDLDETMVRRMLSDLIGDEANSETEYRIHGDLLISDSLDDWSDDELEDLSETSRKRPLYVPPKEEFLRYADWFYFEETPAHDNFAKFIRNKVKLDEEDQTSCELIVGEICAVLRQWAQMQECFDVMELFGIKFRNLKDTKRVTQLLVQMGNNTRIWGNGGMTQIELNRCKQTEAARKHQEKKIGRNEPCPCGSGKKYKHCCGKFLN